LRVSTPGVCQVPIRSNLTSLRLFSSISTPARSFSSLLKQKLIHFLLSELHICYPVLSWTSCYAYIVVSLQKTNKNWYMNHLPLFNVKFFGIRGDQSLFLWKHTRNGRNSYHFVQFRVKEYLIARYCLFKCDIDAVHQKSHNSCPIR